jgi:two-component system CheB/CheR fusion protein
VTIKVAADGDDPSKLLIVGVGASAGGLEALASLLANVTLESMSFVVVQHLSPHYESVLPTLLSRASHAIPVVLAADGMQVEPNHVYVIPPNADLGILAGVLQLITPPAPSQPRHPIDHFFRSLADDQGASAIGVVLSGTGRDGSLGLQSIKAAGGMTFAQDPSSAKYDGMPRAALESGCVDFTGTPHQIAGELMFIGKHRHHAAHGGVRPPERDAIAKILLLIRSAFGNDLSYYKPTTIERRLERRMVLHKIESVDEYRRLVESSTEELRALYKDMLIGVTSFFRDPETFDVVRNVVVPQIAESKKGSSAIRVWVPACSTGEEAYSLTMALLEGLEARQQETRLQVFATDVDEDSIALARRGRYRRNIAADVTPERLRRYFVHEDGGDYTVARRVRDLVVFSTHDLAKEPPFSRMDVISCRNLLIYFQPVMQKKVLRILHYGLNPNGFLVLGTSESVGDAPDLFSVVDAKAKIYRPRTGALLSPIDLGVGASAAPPSRTIQPGGRLRPIINLAQMAERKVLDLFGPPGVVVNENLDVLHFRGRTAPYLEPAPGAATLNLLRLARPEIHGDLRRAIHQAQTEDRHVSVKCTLSDGGELRPFTLEVIPMPDPETRTRCLLVLFHAIEPPPPPASAEAISADAQQLNQRSVELERELLLTKEYLQNSIEELEGANEELQSANEELQSTNEELQSTNEELETSKEEMQSGNEELTTVNEELHNRMGELQETYDDLVNVMNGVDNAVVIVGMDLRIRRFTHAAEKTLGLGSVDVGRPIAQVAFAGGLRLGELAETVIERLSIFEQEVRGNDGRWYALRVTPYKTAEHMIGGAVIVLVDIDARRRSAQLGHDIAGYADQFLAVVRDPLLIVDEQVRVRWANEPYFETFHVVREETIGQLLTQLEGGRWSDAGLTRRIDALLASGTAFRDVTVRVPADETEERTVAVSGSRLPPVVGERLLILLCFAPQGSLPAAE